MNSRTRSKRKILRDRKRFDEFRSYLKMVMECEPYYTNNCFAEDDYISSEDEEADWYTWWWYRHPEHQK